MSMFGFRLFYLISAAMACCLVAGQLNSPANAETTEYVAGHSNWQGTYVDTRAAQAQKVQFRLSLDVASDGNFTGRSAEPATFGNGSSSELYANIVGRIDGLQIRFTKTYDGTGGVSHSVQYNGTMNAQGNSVSGRWSLTGASGTFSAWLTGGHPFIAR